MGAPAGAADRVDRHQSRVGSRRVPRWDALALRVRGRRDRRCRAERRATMTPTQRWSACARCGRNEWMPVGEVRCAGCRRELVAPRTPAAPPAPRVEREPSAIIMPTKVMWGALALGVVLLLIGAVSSHDEANSGIGMVGAVLIVAFFLYMKW